MNFVDYNILFGTIIMFNTLLNKIFTLGTKHCFLVNTNAFHKMRVINCEYVDFYINVPTLKLERK